MKKITALIIITFSFTYISLADMLPMALIPGGNVAPAQNNDIQMQSEIITITLYPKYFLVNVDYIFKNTGNAQKVAMGFPSSSNEGCLATKDFKAYENDSALYVYNSEGSWNFFIKSKHFNIDNVNGGIDKFQCCNVYFKEGEEKKIKNTYKSEYGHCYLKYNYGTYTHRYFNYILQTGSLWKDSIESISLIVNTDHLNNTFKLKESYFQDKKCSLENFDTIFNNVEPNFDFSFLLECTKDMDSKFASSTLYPQKDYNYNISNIDDGNTKTAWIEGVGSYGINEQLLFTSSIDEKWNTLTIQIDSIGIVNGYAFNDTIYSQNSRVKKIKISSGFQSGYFDDNFEMIDFDQLFEDKNTDTYFILKDTPEMQYLVFNPPIKANTLILTILDIYKGSKYSDTAISEIVFFVNQN